MARPATSRQSAATVTGMVSGRAEHISMESEADPMLPPERAPRRKVRSTYKLSSRLRGCETEVSILEDHFLAVRRVRPQAEPCKYELDLRFVNARPVIVRRIAWFWLALTAALALLSVGALWSLWPITGGDWTSPILITAIATVLASVGSAFLFARRTTESLEFVSVHGGATLVSVTGGIGSARGGRQFFVELIKNINAAKAARQQQRPQFLRDEMREHSRLRDVGALGEAEYEASKARILGSH